MKKRNFQIIDMETGQIYLETKDKKKAIQEIEHTITKEDLENPTIELLSYLYKTMKIEGKIDKYGMIKVDGYYVGNDFFKIGEQAGILAENFFKIKSILSFRGFAKSTTNTDCETWTSLMEAFNVNPEHKIKVRKMKKLLLDNDVIREATKPSGKKVFVINPNIIRHGSHTSDFCISVYKDVVLNKVDRYNTYIMYLNGLLEKEDIM